MRELQAQLRDYIRLIDELETENDRLEAQVEILQAHIRNGRPPLKGLIIDALMSGHRTIDAIANFTGLKKDYIRNRLYEMVKLGVIRRRGPYSIKDNMYFYGRKLK